MPIVAKISQIRTSPRKLRLVADLVRPLPVDQALTTLKFLRRRAAQPLLKLIKQARANAVHNFNLPPSGLKIASLEVNGGPTYKRYQAAARGRGHSIKKRTSNIKIVLEAKEEAKNGPKSQS